MRMSEAEFEALMARRGKANTLARVSGADPLKNEISASCGTGKKPSPQKEPNKTENEYRHRLSLEFPSAEIRYEAMSLILDLDGERFRYTPDWVVFLPDEGRFLLVEVKNAGYKHASYGRSKLAFAACRVQWPMFSFRWAEKKEGQWEVENFASGA